MAQPAASVASPSPALKTAAEVRGEREIRSFTLVTPANDGAFRFGRVEVSGSATPAGAQGFSIVAISAREEQTGIYIETRERGALKIGWANVGVIYYEKKAEAKERAA